MNVLRHAVVAICGLLSVVSVSAQFSDEPVVEGGVSDYIRYIDTEPGSDSRLQTALTRFSKGDVVVDLVAVVHLGDAGYYQNLNTYLSRYDAVLYELVGGQYEAGQAERPAEGDVGAVRGLQQMAQSFLGLEMQLEQINYEASNFVHADVDWEQFEELMQAREQSFGTIFTRAASLAESGEAGSLNFDEATVNAIMNQLVTAIVTGDTSTLKRTIAPFLSDAEELITQIEGEDGTVLVTERNKVVVAKIHEVVASGSAKKVAIFYGAGHMPDLEERLLAEGYSKGETTWADAWVIPPVGQGEVNDGLTPAEMMLKLLTGNPEMMDVLQQMGSVLEALQQMEPIE